MRLFCAFGDFSLLTPFGLSPLLFLTVMLMDLLRTPVLFYVD